MEDRTLEFDGEKYCYVVRLEDCGSDTYTFEIDARDKASRLMSTVTNLNYVLFHISCVEEAEEEDKAERFMESTWELISLEEANTVWNETIGILTDKLSIKYLERNLDEDREEGEWQRRY